MPTFQRYWTESSVSITPLGWPRRRKSTPYFRLAVDRRVIQLDRRRWDYKHQVLATRHMPPWRVLLWFKFTEMVLQGRPKALYRTFLHPDRGLRHAMRWRSQMGRRVWPYEIFHFLRDVLVRDGPTVQQFGGCAAGRRGGINVSEAAGAAGRPRRRVASPAFSSAVCR
jgi:anaerobic magnesium-protoporphyrin IX monomethyl ester cyclase